MSIPSKKKRQISNICTQIECFPTSQYIDGNKLNDEEIPCICDFNLPACACSSLQAYTCNCFPDNPTPQCGCINDPHEQYNQISTHYMKQNIQPLKELAVGINCDCPAQFCICPDQFLSKCQCDKLGNYKSCECKAQNNQNFVNIPFQNTIKYSYPQQTEQQNIMPYFPIYSQSKENDSPENIIIRVVKKKKPRRQHRSKKIPLQTNYKEY
ncbi:hypothetical protein HZS_1058 [Henneguya salminicola]|nr:hypothetical protein HZS_1058 [Henneguya salminicola]